MIDQVEKNTQACQATISGQVQTWHGGTKDFIRTKAASVNVNAKTNTVKKNRVTGSRNTMAMMRGVS